MDTLDTTSEFIIEKTRFGDRKRRNPNYANNSGLNSIEALEKEQKRKNDEMISNLQPDSSGFGSNYGGKKSRKSRKGKRSRRSRRSRRSKRY